MTSFENYLKLILVDVNNLPREASLIEFLNSKLASSYLYNIPNKGNLFLVFTNFVTNWRPRSHSMAGIHFEIVAFVCHIPPLIHQKAIQDLGFW